MPASVVSERDSRRTPQAVRKLSVSVRENAGAPLSWRFEQSPGCAHRDLLEDLIYRGGLTVRFTVFQVRVRIGLPHSHPHSKGPNKMGKSWKANEVEEVDEMALATGCWSSWRSSTGTQPSTTSRLSRLSIQHWNSLRRHGRRNRRGCRPRIRCASAASAVWPLRVISTSATDRLSFGSERLSSRTSPKRANVRMKEIGPTTTVIPPISDPDLPERFSSRGQYSKSLAKFDAALCEGCAVSQATSGKVVRPSLAYATHVFARILAHGRNLIRSVPRSRWCSSDYDDWDFGANAGNFRSIMEAALLFHYLCDADPDPDNQRAVVQLMPL